MAKILRIFSDVDMWNSHDGLAIIAKKHKIDVHKLVHGEYVMFINTAKNKIKFYAANNVIAYYKHEHGKLDMRAIQLIPETFESEGRINYDKAVEKILIKELGYYEQQQQQT